MGDRKVQRGISQEIPQICSGYFSASRAHIPIGWLSLEHVCSIILFF